MYSKHIESLIQAHLSWAELTLAKFVYGNPARCCFFLFPIFFFLFTKLYMTLMMWHHILNQRKWSKSFMRKSNTVPVNHVNLISVRHYFHWWCKSKWPVALTRVLVEREKDSVAQIDIAKSSKYETNNRWTWLSGLYTVHLFSVSANHYYKFHRWALGTRSNSINMLNTTWKIISKILFHPTMVIGHH